jgi:hypothetical protein
MTSLQTFVFRAAGLNAWERCFKLRSMGPSSPGKLSERVLTHSTASLPNLQYTLKWLRSQAQLDFSREKTGRETLPSPRSDLN